MFAVVKRLQFWAYVLLVTGCADCSDEVTKLYGQTYSLRVPQNAYFLEFSFMGEDESVLLWDRTDPGVSEGDRGHMDGNWWVIYNVTQHDQGRYSLRAQNKRLIKTHELWVSADDPPYFYIGVGVGILLMVLLCCCCVRRCCCKKSSSKRDDSAPESAAAPAVYYHDNTSLPSGPSTCPPAFLQQPSGPTNPTYSPGIACPSQSPGLARPSQPSGPAYPSQPTVTVHDPLVPASTYTYTYEPTGPLTAREPESRSLEPPVPASGGPAAAPSVSLGSDCPSSDPGPRFELKGLSIPSAPPLSSDSTHCDIYTSDKLNFL